MNTQGEGKQTVLVALVDAAQFFVALHPQGAAMETDVPYVMLKPGAEDGLVSAALVDENGLFVRIDRVAPGELTNRHLPRFAALDLDAARGYKWTPTPEDATNALGGRWDPLPRKTPEQRFDAAEPLPALAMFWIALYLRDENALPVRTRAWLDEYVRSIDFRSTLEDSPEAREYWRRRGLKN